MIYGKYFIVTMLNVRALNARFRVFYQDYQLCVFFLARKLSSSLKVLSIIFHTLQWPPIVVCGAFC